MLEGWGSLEYSWHSQTSQTSGIPPGTLAFFLKPQVLLFTLGLPHLCPPRPSPILFSTHCLCRESSNAEHSLGPRPEGSLDYSDLGPVPPLVNAQWPGQGWAALKWVQRLERVPGAPLGWVVRH